MICKIFVISMKSTEEILVHFSLNNSLGHLL